MENSYQESHVEDLGIPERTRLPHELEEKAQQIWKSGSDCARENPGLVALGVLIAGVFIGLACGCRSPKKKTSVTTVRDLADDILSNISDRWPQIKNRSCCSSSLLDQAQKASKKLKWW